MRSSVNNILTVITGGSASGKSEYGEELAVRHNGKRIYIATMYPYDDESKQRVIKHRAARADKSFETVECFLDLSTAFKACDNPIDSVVMIECMSNLLANEMFMDNGCLNGIDDIKRLKAVILEKIVNPIISAADYYSEIIIITNEIFMDGCNYDEVTTRYIELLAFINNSLANAANRVAEVVCSIPVYIKGEDIC